MHNRTNTRADLAGTDMALAAKTDHQRLTEAKKAKKRVQNRIYQRAHRLRKQIKSSQRPKSDGRLFQVDRWRLDELDASQSGDVASIPASGPLEAHSPRQGRNVLRQLLPSTCTAGQDLDSSVIPMESGQSRFVDFPLSTDHLLHLVHYNVLRGLFSNKSLLRVLAIYRKLPFEMPKPHPSNFLCHGYTTVHPIDSNIPNCLIPTVLQMSQPHSSWIDMLPFPQMRDNLIRREACFDHREILKDLSGEVWNDNLPVTTDRLMWSPRSDLSRVQEEDDDPVTNGRYGLIVWGEPYENTNWEATPGFLRKWAWVVEGCRELVHVSNRWRMSRGAEPLQIPTIMTYPSDSPAFSITSHT
ncbi:hypothetical protein GQ53DRAFT_675800 [Thozetella sp. PMI_491]|nr:hypothetical protein GQ53DRAFT_675800 [Thozetella sp. PMI_491]